MPAYQAIGIFYTGHTRRKRFFKSIQPNTILTYCTDLIIDGYTSLITGNVNFIIQEALTDCATWVTNYAAFLKLYDTHPELERIFDVDMSNDRLTDQLDQFRIV